MFQNTILSDVLSCFNDTTEGASLYFGSTLADHFHIITDLNIFLLWKHSHILICHPRLFLLFKCTSIFNVQ